MQDNHMTTGVSRRRWLRNAAAVATAGGIVSGDGCSTNTSNSQTKAASPDALESFVGPSSASERIHLMMRGKVQTQILYVAAKLGIADLLTDGPKLVDELAEVTETHAPALYRVLRALASLGIFAEPEPKRFCLTPAAEMLRSDHPRSLKDFAIMYGSEWHTRSWPNILFSVRTGNPAFDHTFGTGIFPYLQQHPEDLAVFNASQTSASKTDASAVVEAYDFSKFETIVDLGGGKGLLLATILKANPRLKGTIFELPRVAKEARKFLNEQGVGDRAEVVISKDFFVTIPKGLDLYALKYIIHDWTDEQSGQILRSCRRAISPNGRVLIMEMVIPPDNSQPLFTLNDITMLVHPGGKERSEDEFRALLTEAGFRLNRIVSTNAYISIIEGVPV